MRNIESRIDRLLNDVMYKREHGFSTINADEQAIIKNAENFRLMDGWSHGKAEQIVKSSRGWMQKQELLRFLSSTTDKTKWSNALSLAEWAAASDLSFNSGVLNKIMINAEEQGVPPEWIAAEELNDKKPETKEHEDSGFHINKEALS